MAAPELGTVLAVFAHPDDETYLCAGILARAVRAGDRVVCVTATRGELGSTDEHRWPAGASLAALRTVEMAAAMRALGVSEHHWLDYPDGGCADVDESEAVGRLRDVVADVRPDTVLTFGPEGMTGHDDHKTVCRWTMRALSGHTASVHWATNSPEWLAEWREPLTALGAFMSGEPPCTPVDELSLHLRLDDDLLDAKFAAITAQESQVTPMLQAFGPAEFRRGLAEEAFRLADVVGTSTR